MERTPYNKDGIAAKVERNDELSKMRDELIAEICPEGVEEPKSVINALKEFANVSGTSAVLRGNVSRCSPS